MGDWILTRPSRLTMTSLDVHLILERLGSRLGVTPIVADEHGSAGVRLSDGSSLGLQIDSLADELCLYADLGALPDTPGLAEELLQMQLFGRHTGGGSIAIGPNLQGEPHLVLWRSLPLVGLDEHTLLSVLTRLGDAAHAWRRSLEASALDAPAPRATDSPAAWLDTPPAGAAQTALAPRTHPTPPPRGFA